MPCNGLSLLQRNLLWSIIKKGHVMTFYLCFPCHRETPRPVNLNNHLNIMNLSAIYHGSALVRQYRNMDCGLWSYDFNNIFHDLSNRLGFCDAICLCWFVLSADQSMVLIIWYQVYIWTYTDLRRNNLHLHCDKNTWKLIQRIEKLSSKTPRPFCSISRINSLKLTDAYIRQ